MDRDEHPLLAEFLAGELDPAEASRWDDHLLECERCWRAVREDRDGRRAAGLLRRSAPAGLADQVAFAVELAATGTRTRRGNRRRRTVRWRWLAGAGTLAAGLAAAVLLVLLPTGHPGVPAPVAAVARYAAAIPPPARPPEPGASQRPAPVKVGHPVTMTAGGQRIVVATWRVDGVDAAVAVSGRPFPMPPGGEAGSGAGMAWSARLGKLGLYCVNGQRSELVAAAVPVTELHTLAARLPAP